MHGKNNGSNFLENLTTYILTHEFSKERITYLELRVGISNGKLYTDLHMKSTDCHQYVDFTLSHPEHIEKAIIYSHTLSFRRVSFFEKDFRKHEEIVKSWFLQKDDPEEVVNENLNKAKKVTHTFSFSVTRGTYNIIHELGWVIIA